MSFILSEASDGTIEAALHARAFAEYLPPVLARILDLGESRALDVLGLRPRRDWPRPR